jgi:hypothetical protein
MNYTIYNLTENDIEVIRVGLIKLPIEVALPTLQLIMNQVSKTREEAEKLKAQHAEASVNTIAEAR